MPTEIGISHQPTGGDTLAFLEESGSNEARVFVALGATEGTIQWLSQVARGLMRRDCLSCRSLREGQHCSHLAACEVISAESVTGYDTLLSRFQSLLQPSLEDEATDPYVHLLVRRLETRPVYVQVPPRTSKVNPKADEEYRPPARRLRDITRLEVDRLAELFGVTRVAYSNWIAGVTPRSDREDRLLRVLSLAEEVLKRLGSPEAVRDWLLAPVSFLGRRPFDVMREGEDDTITGLVLAIGTQSRPVRLPKRPMSAGRWQAGQDLDTELQRLNPGYSTGEE